MCWMPQTKQKLYDKDLDFSYKPFLSILGSGLVTANGAHWQKQRLLMVRRTRAPSLGAAWLLQEGTPAVWRAQAPFKLPAAAAAAAASRPASCPPLSPPPAAATGACAAY